MDVLRDAIIFGNTFPAPSSAGSDVNTACLLCKGTNKLIPVMELITSVLGFAFSSDTTFKTAAAL